MCRPQVPFAHGGTEVMTDALVVELRARGHEADLISVPFKWYPGVTILTHAFLWRLVDLAESDVDVVIATKFPSYVISHPEKRVWLIHQFRQAYELDGTPLAQFDTSPEQRALRRRVQRLDLVTLGEARRLFAISQNVADRLARSTALTAEVLVPPPQDLAYRHEGVGDFILSVNRLDRAKRIDLLLDAARLVPSMRVVVVGEGPDRERLVGMGEHPELAGRVEFRGRVPGDELAALYATCLALYYAPVDEDMGIAPYEAFRSAKPVVTTTDSGGPLEVVTDGETGIVVSPEPVEVARALAWLQTHNEAAVSLGQAGKTVAERITWDHTISRLLS